MLGAFFGHDHLNDFSGYVDGIYLAQHKTAGFRAYTDGCRSCVRLLTLDENDLGSFEQELRHFKEFGLECECLGPIFKRISDRQSTNMHIAAKILGAAAGTAALAVGAKYIIKAKLGKKEKNKMEKSAKLGKLTLLNIILFGFIGQVAWAVENNFFNTFLFSFGGTTKDISTMVAASAVVAVVTTFVMGTLSDKLGRRKVFICAGYVAWGITVMAFAFISRENLGKLIGADPSSAAALSATVTTVIVMDCIMTFMGSTSNDSAFNAWITDVTVPSNRAKTEVCSPYCPCLLL